LKEEALALLRDLGISLASGVISSAATLLLSFGWSQLPPARLLDRVQQEGKVISTLCSDVRDNRDDYDDETIQICSRFLKGQASYVSQSLKLRNKEGVVGFFAHLQQNKSPEHIRLSREEWEKVQNYHGIFPPE
jgi:hypothetical protein